MVVPTPNMIFFLFYFKHFTVEGARGWMVLGCVLVLGIQEENQFSHGPGHNEGGRAFGLYVLTHWSDLAFLGPAPFMSGEPTGLFMAGFAADPSLPVSCSHLTCVAGP